LIANARAEVKESRTVVQMNLEAFVATFKDTPNNYAITAEYRMKAHERVNMVIEANLYSGYIAKNLHVLVYCRFYAIRGMIYSGLWGQDKFPHLEDLKCRLKDQSMHDEAFPEIARRTLNTINSAFYKDRVRDYYLTVLEEYLQNKVLAAMMIDYERSLYEEIRSERSEILMANFDSFNQDTNRYAVKKLMPDIERLSHPKTWRIHNFLRQIGL
jgi:hypothetical protein